MGLFIEAYSLNVDHLFNSIDFVSYNLIFELSC